MLASWQRSCEGVGCTGDIRWHVELRLQCSIGHASVLLKSIFSNRQPDDKNGDKQRQATCASQRSGH